MIKENPTNCGRKQHWKPVSIHYLYFAANSFIRKLTTFLQKVCKGAHFLSKLQTKSLNIRTDYRYFWIWYLGPRSYCVFVLTHISKRVMSINQNRWSSGLKEKLLWENNFFITTQNKILLQRKKDKEKIVDSNFKNRNSMEEI